MVRGALTLVCCVWFVGQLTDAKSVYRSKSFFPLHKSLHKRQADLDQEMVSGGWDGEEPPQCVREMVACMAGPNLFINDWTRAYMNQEPFRTDAARVIAFCSNVAAARSCVDAVGVCEASYIPEAMEHLNICNPEVMAALIAMDGSICQGTVEDDPLMDQCTNAYYASLTTTTTTTPEPILDWDQIVNYTSYSVDSYSTEDMCREARAHLACSLQSYRRNCGTQVAHFIGLVSRSEIERCQRK